MIPKTSHRVYGGMKMKKTISSSIYPIDNLKKQLQTLRDEAFAESAWGSRERKLRLQEKVNTLDIVLDMIKDGGK